MKTINGEVTEMVALHDLKHLDQPVESNALRTPTDGPAEMPCSERSLQSVVEARGRCGGGGRESAVRRVYPACGVGGASI